MDGNNNTNAAEDARRKIPEANERVSATKRNLFAKLLLKKFADAEGGDAPEKWLSDFEVALESYVSSRISRAMIAFQATRAEPI